MATVKWEIGNCTVEVTGQELKATVEELAAFLEYFNQAHCGMCQSKDIVPSHRNSGGYSYYEFACNKCGGTLKFGQTQEGGRLFAKRKLADGSWDKAHNGWQPPFQKQQTPSDDWGEL